MRKLFILFSLLFSLSLHAQEIGIIAASTGSAAFTPLALSPIAWYDSRSADMSATGDYWNDRMGNYNMTATGTARPTYNATALNGLPGFVFDGLTNILVCNRITQIQNTANVTIAMVSKRGIVAQCDGTTNNEIRLHHYLDDNYYGVVDAGGGLNYGSVATTNVFHYTLLVYDGTATGNANRERIYSNGVNQTLSFTGTIPALTENSGSSTGSIGSNNIFYMACTIVEVIIVNRTITAGEITSLNTYLAAKYGLCIGMIIPGGFTKEGFILFYIVGFGFCGLFGTYLYKTRDNFKQAA